MEKFSGYAFNKSHSAAYAFLAYVTAYLKANFPLEYMASLLTSEMSNLEKLSKYIEELLRLGFKILPPSITKSKSEFSVEGNAIRFGLGGIKGLGEAAVKAIEEMRQRVKITSFEGFIKNAQRFKINKKVIETLVKAGAFDEFTSREKALNLLDALLSQRPTLFDNGNKQRQYEIEKMEIETIGVLLSKSEIKHQIESISYGIFPIEFKDIAEIIGRVKKIIQTPSGHILTCEVSYDPRENYEILLIGKNGKEIKEGKIYVFVGKKAQRKMISFLFFEPSEMSLLIKVQSLSYLLKIREILKNQPDGNLEVLLEVGKNVVRYKRKIFVLPSFKGELWENGAILFAIPSSQERK
jgi:DNA polymerase-3 subunit alpha